MELIVDLIEITRIPYSELETVYISSNLAITPKGSRSQTKISSGNKIVKFNPHRFSFLIDDVINTPSSALVITVFSQLTNFRQIPISYVSIPLNTIPHRSTASLSLETTSLSSCSISPIVVVSLGIDINVFSARMQNEISIMKNLPKVQMQHPSAILGIDYSTCEDPPNIEFDSFGRLKPPENYIAKFNELLNQDIELFKQLIHNDSLRKFVLTRATEYYNHLENNITINDSENNVLKPNQAKKSKKKFSKSSHSKNPDHIPQPPLEPPNPRRQIRNDDNSLEAQDNSQNQTPIPIQSQRQIQQAIKKEMWTISINNMKSNQARKPNNQPPQHSMIPPSQPQSQPQQNASPPQNPPSIGQISVINSIAQLPHKTESPPKAFVHGVAVDPKKSIRQKPPTGQDIEIQKPLILKKKGAPDYEKPPMRGLLAPKHNEDKGPPLNPSNKKNRTICMAPNKKQKYPPDNYSMDNDNYSMDNDNFDKLSQCSMPAVVLSMNPSTAPNPIKNQHGIINSHIRNRSPSPTTGLFPPAMATNDFNPHKAQQPSKIKPQPPPQIQSSMMAPQSGIDASPRRPRQTQD